MQKLRLVGAVALVGLATSATAGVGFDFGSWRDYQLRAWSSLLFGVFGPLKASSTESVDAATAEADPRSLVRVAKSLRVRVVTSEANAAPNLDMIALWPNDHHPTHLIVCNEEGPAEPGVQRVRLSDGLVETILTGTTACDPVLRTPWGTILAGEEAGNSGQVIEIINPLATTDVVFDRVSGTSSGGIGAANVASRRAVGRLSFEGIALYPNGVTPRARRAARTSSSFPRLPGRGARSPSWASPP